MTSVDEALRDVEPWRTVNAELEDARTAQGKFAAHLVALEAETRQRDQAWQTAAAEAHAAGEPTPPALEPVGDEGDSDRARAYIGEIARLAARRRQVLAQHAPLIEGAAALAEDQDLQDAKLARAVAVIADAAGRATARAAVVLEARTAADVAAGRFGLQGTAARTRAKVTPGDVLAAVQSGASLLAVEALPAVASGEIISASRYRPDVSPRTFGMSPRDPFGNPPTGMTTAPAAPYNAARMR